MGTPYDEFLWSRVVDTPAVPTPGASGYFSRPTPALDHRLFDGDVMRPEIRDGVVSMLYRYWGARYAQPDQWSTVWIAGSALSHQWDADRGGLGDLDVLIGVDYQKFYAANPEYRGIPQDDLSEMFNSEFRAELQPLTATLSFPVNFEAWQNELTRLFPESFTSTAKATQPTTSVENSALARTRSSDDYAPTMLNQTRIVPASPGAVDDPVLGSVPGVMTPATPTESADPVLSVTNGSGISSANTASRSPNMSESWWSRKTAAASAASRTPPTSRLITATTPAQSEDFSASPATTVLASSETQSMESVAPLNTLSGGPLGPFEVTFFVNPGATDIRDIRPYAAYNLSSDEWTVRPPDLPDDWDPEVHMPAHWWAAVHNDEVRIRDAIAHYEKARQRVADAEGAGYRVSAMSALRQTTNDAARLFDEVHEGRRNAFKSTGEGFFDFYNFRWQALKRSGLIKTLHSIKAASAGARTQASEQLYGDTPASAPKARATALRWASKRT